MLKQTTFLVAGVVLSSVAFTSSPARASCGSNPAICQAICNCSCCTTKTGCKKGGFKANPGRSTQASLKKFSTSVLQRQMKAKKTDAIVKRALASEISRRTAAGKAKPK